MMEQLKSFFEGKYLCRFLDLGTGSGQFVSKLLKLFPEGEFIGIDPNPQWFDQAKAMLPFSNVSFEVMPAEKLEFEDNSFDLISMSNALHHLPELEKSLFEMKRVVKTDGWIVISELISDNLNPAQENQKFYHHLKSYVDRVKGEFHHETWRRQEIIDIIEKNGISVKTTFDYYNDTNFITDTENIEYWVSRLKTYIGEIKRYPQYQELIPKIAEFRKRLNEGGMQHATNVVIIGQKL